MMNKKNQKKRQWIDDTTAERITALTLKNYRSCLKKELKAWKKNRKGPTNPNGIWLHPDDIVSNMRTIAALDLVISCF